MVFLISNVIYHTVRRAQIEDLVSLVSRESKMRLRLDSIMEQWQAAELELVDYKSKGPIFLNVCAFTHMLFYCGSQVTF